MAHEIAGELEVTPWEALLGEVRRAAHRVAWLDAKLATAEEDEDLVRGGRLYEFKRWQDLERQQLARVSKMAIDGGVAERLVAQVGEDAQAIAGVLLRTLERLGLDEALDERARGILRQELLALDAGGVVDGEWSEEERK
jgi:hypothetical protein